MDTKPRAPYPDSPSLVGQAHQQTSNVPGPYEIPQHPPAYSAEPPTVQPGFYPPPPQQQTYYPLPNPAHQFQTYVVPIVGHQHVGPQPCSTVCPSCHKQIVSRVNFETSTKTHIMAALLCVFICWPCAWVPYVMDSCKNGNHYCPDCGCFIGSYRS